jgi:hypothetical protein
MESKKINQLATELAPDLSDITIIGDPTTGISKKITLSQMASLFTGTVEEYANFAAFPLVGVADTIYIAKDTNVIYRWDSTAYVVLSPNIIASLVFNDANGFDGTIALVGSVATLTITTALTSGSVPFIGASGALTQDNANLFFDDTNNRLGLGTNTPTTALDVFGSGIIGRLNATSTNNAYLGFASASTNKWSVGNVQSDHRFRIFSEVNSAEIVSVLQTGEFGIGIANPLTKFHIDGGASALIANLDANVSVAKTLSFRSDNSNRINLEVSGTESGSNAGADFFLRTYTDLGALIETPFTIVRSTGVTTIKSLTLTNALAIANGGTGSTTKNFVDLTTAQTIAGVKTFSSNIIVAPTIYTGGIQFGTTSASTIGYDAGTGLMSLNINAGAAASTSYYKFLADGSSILTILKSGSVGILSAPYAMGTLTSGLVNISSDFILQSLTNGQNTIFYNAYLNSSNTFVRINAAASSGITQDSGDIIFRAAPTGTAGGTITTWDSTALKMVIKNSGNVGIANTIPDTFSTASGYGNLVVGSGSGAQGITIFGGTTGQSGLMFADTSTGSGAYTGYVLYSHTTDKMEFATGGGTPRMTINSSGDVGLGSAPSTGNRLIITGSSTAGGDTSLYIQNSALTNTFFVRNDGYIVTGLAALSPYNWAATGTTKVLYVNNNGGIGYSSSNRESKININKIDNANWINELNPVTFNKRKKDEEENFTDEYYDELHYGFIADEMEAINSDFVFYDERNGEKKLAGIHYDRMIAPLVKVIQDLNERVKQLESK